MENSAQQEAEGAQHVGEALQIPSLKLNGAALSVAAPGVNKTSADYKAGVADGAAACQEHLDAEKSRLAAVGAGLKNALRDIDLRGRQECAALVEKIVTALAPSIARQSAAAEMRSIIKKYAVEKKQPLTIRIHPDLAGDLSMGGAEDVSDAAPISIETDENLSPNAVDISWTDGGMFFDPDALIADLSRVLSGQNKASEE